METEFSKDLSLIIGTATSGNTELKFPFPVASATETAEIGVLDLSPRAFNALKRNNINNVSGILDIFGDLSKLRNVGGVTIREIRNKTAAYLYDCMTATDKKYFWKEFIELNNIQGISAK